MAEHHLTCRGCGGQFTYHQRKRYCFAACYPSRRPKPDRYANAVTRTVHECFWCGKGFIPKRSDRLRYCSRECRFDFMGAKARLLAPVMVRVRRHKRKPPLPKGPTVLACWYCGTSFQSRGRQGRQACSDECRAKGKADARARWRCSDAGRASKKRRKAVERGALRAEAVDPIKVFERDAYRCGICGKRTLKAKRGTYHDRAPELDHIMPVSRGGEHSYANTQCSCRACNIAKAATPFGQLHLFPAE